MGLTTIDQCGQWTGHLLATLGETDHVQVTVGAPLFVELATGESKTVHSYII